MPIIFMSNVLNIIIIGHKSLFLVVGRESRNGPQDSRGETSFGSPLLNLVPMQGEDSIQYYTMLYEATAHNLCASNPCLVLS